MATNVTYSKQVSQTLNTINISNNYKKPYIMPNISPLVNNDLFRLTETYILDDGITELKCEITHTGTISISMFYEIYIDNISVEGPTLFETLNPAIDFEGIIMFGIAAGEIIFQYTDSFGVIQETFSIPSSYTLIDPLTSIAFDFLSSTITLDRLSVEITEFATNYVIIPDVQDVGEEIYPIVSYSGISSNHSIVNFQTEKVIEWVVKDNDLYVTTGTKLVALRYVTLPDGVIVLVAQEVDQYAFEPNTQEAAIGGLNLIKEDPFLSISDFEQGYTFNPDFIRTKTQKGIANVTNLLRCFVTLESGNTINDYDFKVEAQKSSTDDTTVFDILINDFTNGDDGRQVKLLLAEPSTYNIKVTMREEDDLTEENWKEAFLFTYEVTNTDTNADINLDDTNLQINQCLKIVLFYGKIIVYDNGTPNIYKSYSARTTWFTVSGVIPLNALRQEKVNKIITLDDALLGFTENSIIALVGKGDDLAIDGRPYEPFVAFITLDENIGALAPESVVHTNDGRLIFLSNDGLYIITEVRLNEKTVVTKKIDDRINNIILRDSEASAIMYDNKYYLSFPSENRIVKWHFVYNDIFSLDESVELRYRKMYVYNNIMYGISILNKLMEHQKIVNDTLISIDELSLSNQGLFIDDEEVFVCEFETKNFDFEFPERVKRLFEFTMGFNSVRDEEIEIFINVFGDNVPLISTDENGVVITQDIDGNDIVSSYDRTENDLSQQNPNIQGNTPIILGTWLLGENVLGFFPQTFRYFEILDTKESMRMKLNVKHQQDTYLLIFRTSFVFDVGYIPKDNIRL